MEFLNVGEKIKKLRKQLRLRQEGLSDSNITRAYISMIEIGKRTPSKEIAATILSKVRKRAEELGVELNVDDDYLIRDAREEVEFYCIEKLEIIDTISELEDIVGIAKSYKLDAILVKSYIKLGDIYYRNNDYKNANINYTKCFEYNNNLVFEEIESYLYKQLGLCKLYQIQYAEAINYFNISYSKAILKNNEDIKKRSLYNIALCNKKLNKIDEALKIIEEFLLICDKRDNFDLFVYAITLKATCFESKKLIDEAINVLMKLIEDFSNPYDELIVLVYGNLGELYLEKDDFNKSLHYFNWAAKIRENLGNKYLCRILIEKSYIYIKQKSYNEAIDLLKEGLELTIKYNDYEYQLKAYYTLTEIYIELKMYNDAEKIYLQILNILLYKDCFLNKNEVIKTYSKLSFIYLEQNKIDNTKEILLKLQEIS